MNMEILNNAYAIQYHFDNELLDFDITEPLSIVEDEHGNHIITEVGGITWIVKPTWVYISIKDKVIR
jgi:hypothetical protein